MASATALSLNHVLNSPTLLIASVSSNPFIVSQISKVSSFPSALSAKISTPYNGKLKHPPPPRASGEGLEPAVFAALVPNSADKPLQELIEEIIGDHEMLES